VDQPWRSRRRSVSGQPAERPLECGRGVAHLVQPPAPFRELVRLGEADAAGVGAMDRGQRLRTLFQQATAPRLIEAPVDAPAERLTADRFADQKRITQRRRGIVDSKDVGDWSARGRRAPLDRRLQFHAGVYVVRGAGAQDQ